MKVRYIGSYYEISLVKGKIYDVMSIEKGWYRIFDETEDDYLYPPKSFEIVDDSIDGVPVTD